MGILGLVLAGLAALTQQSPPVPASAQSPCARVLQWGADVAVAEICAGEDASRLAAAANAGPDSRRHLERAVAHYRRAASASTVVEAQVVALTLLAECYDAKHLNDMARMEAALREIMRLLPDDLAPVARLAQLQEEQGLLEAAEATLLESRRQHPDAIDAYKLLAQFYARRVTALTKYQTAQTADPTSGPGEADASGVYRVGGSLTPPPRLDVPQYPQDAQAAGIKGVVVAEVVIDAAGRVTDTRVVQSIPLLDDAALQAVRNWQYAPTIINGQPVPVRMNVSVNFSLAPERAGPAKTAAPR